MDDPTDVLTKSPVPPPPTDEDPTARLISLPVPPPPKQSDGTVVKDNAEWRAFAKRFAGPEPEGVAGFSTQAEMARHRLDEAKEPLADALDAAGQASQKVQDNPAVHWTMDKLGRPVRSVETLINTQPTPFWSDPKDQPGTGSAIINTNPVTAILNAGGNMGRNILQGHLPFGGEGKAVFPDFKHAVTNMADLPEGASPEEKARFEQQTQSPSVQFGDVPRYIGRALTTEVGQDPDVGKLPGQIATQPTFINPDGTINKTEAFRHLLDFGMEQGARAGADPMNLILPAIIPKIARAAPTISHLIDTVSEAARPGGAALPMAERFADLPAAAQAALPSLKSSIAAGEASLAFQTPWSGQAWANVPIPKMLAKIPGLDALTKIANADVPVIGPWIDKMVKNPSPKTVDAMAQRQAIGAAHVAAERYRTVVAGITKEAMDSSRPGALNVDEVNTASLLSEAHSPVQTGIRTNNPALAAKLTEYGFDVTGDPVEFEAELAKLKDAPAETPKVSAEPPKAPQGYEDYIPPAREIRPRVEGQPLYTRVDRVLETKFPDARQWKNGPTLLSQLKKYVHPEELADTGLETLLSERTPITRAEVQEMVKNAPQVSTQVNAGTSDTILGNGDVRYQNMRLQNSIGQWDDATLKKLASGELPLNLGQAENYREILFKQEGLSYTHQHWQDEPGVIAHARVQDRILPSGKALEIQELQSDIHQIGKKEGYEQTPADSLNRKMWEANPAEGPRPTKVPDAAFKESWPRLGMKQLLEEGAKGDYKYVTWPGEAQQVAKIERWGWEGDASTLRARTEAVLKDAKDNLVALAGHEHERIYADAKRQVQHAQETLDGIESQTSIARWYTDELPNNIRKYVEPAGGKLSKIDTPNGKMWAVEMTPELKARILREGQPLYGNMPSKTKWVEPTAEDRVPGSAGAAENVPPAQRSELYDDVMKEYKAGMDNHNAAVAKSLSDMSTWGPDKLARAKVMIDQVTEATKFARDKYLSITGANIPQLGGQFLGRPKEIFDRLAEIKDEVLKPGLSERALNKLNNEKVALEIELPSAMRKYAAAPNYRPGLLTEDELAASREGVNPNLGRPGADMSKETAQRGYRHGHDIGGVVIGDPALQDVPFSVSQHQAEYTKAGIAAPDPRHWLEKATNGLLPEGLKAQLRSVQDGTVFEPNILNALWRDTYKWENGVRARLLDQATMKLYKNYPAKWVDAARKAAQTSDRGALGELTAPMTDADRLKLDQALGRKPAVTPIDPAEAALEMEINKSSGKTVLIQGEGANRRMWLNGKEIAPQFIDDVLARIKAAEEGGAPKASITPQRADFSQVQAAWEKAGGPADVKVESLLSDDVRKAVEANTMSVKDAFSVKFKPEGTDMAVLNDVPTYINKGVADSLKEFKALSNDPYRTGQFFKSIVPVYAWGMNKWRAMQQYLGPQWLRTQANYFGMDMVQAVMGHGVDGLTLSEMERYYHAFKQYHDPASLRDVSGFDGIQFAGLNGEPVPGRAALAELGQNNVLGRGEIQGDIGANQERINSPATRYSAKGLLQAGSDTLKKFDTIGRAMEDAKRAAVFNTYKRQGLSGAEAAQHTELTLFDYSRTSPMVNFLKQSGIAPFITWPSKGIPFAIDWMLHYPGEFAAVMHTLDQMKLGQLDDKDVPQYMKGQFNRVVHRESGPDGKMWVMVENDKWLPWDEVAQLHDNLAKVTGGNPAGGAWFVRQLGLPMQMAFQLNDDAKERDEAKRTSWDVVKQMGQVIGGRPLRIGQQIASVGEVDPNTGQTTTGGDVANSLFNPIELKTIDLNKEGVQSVKSAESSFNGSKIEYGKALGAYNAAKDANDEAQGRLNQLGVITSDPAALAKLQQKAAEAKARFDREKAQVLQKFHRLNYNRQLYERMNRTN